MTVIESIVQAVQNLPLREQVEVARYVHRLSTSVQQRRDKMLRRPTACSTKRMARPSSKR